MVGFCHLTDSHHNHHGQKPTMVGTCHGGNMLGNRSYYDLDPNLCPPSSGHHLHRILEDQEGLGLHYKRLKISIYIRS